MDPKDLKAIIKLCKKEGVLSFKSKDLEFTLSPSAISKKLQAQSDDKIEQTTQYDPEALIDWSSGGIGNNA